MNILKKSFAMFLVFCMLIGAVPMTVFATDIDSTEPTVAEPAEETAEEATEATEETTETTADPYGQSTLALDDELSVASTTISTITMGTKPDAGSTTGEPFPQNAAGSNSFRIPALVTLDDGTLVAAADARWNTTYDGGGLDTIVSRSGDNGDNWSYSFANYLGDNGNAYSGTGSTAFIDPALAVAEDGTIYMLCDLYPYGVALNGSVGAYPSTSVGFNSQGKLLLSGDNHSTYGYYLDGNTIYSSDGTAVSGYTVDEYFNITAEDGSTSNLFFSNSPYKVVRTGFLYLTKSTDGGITWSAPELLNLKTSSEQVCLVGPGRGLVTSKGTIVFPVYSYNGSQASQKMSFISSTDGVNWTRYDDFSGASWSSEAAVVELTDGTLRFFYRNGTTNLCYADYNNGWGSAVVMTGIDTNSNCQISAITYSKTIDGKQVILVSCPTGPREEGSDQSGASYRLNGKIFAFTVESDGSMTKVGSVNVTSNDAQFMYSCLTELADGTVGILYEDKENAWGAGSSCYYTMSYGEYDLTTAMDLTFDSADSGESGGGEETEESDVTITDGATMVSATKVEDVTALSDKTYLAYDITVNEASVESATVVVKLNGTFADDAALVAHYINDNGEIAETINGTYDTAADTFTFIATHFSTYAVTTADDTDSDVTITETVEVRIPVGGTSEPYTVDGVYVTSLDDLNTDVASATLGGNAGSEATVNYSEADVSCNDLIDSNSDSWEATGYYYTPDNGSNYYPLYAIRSGKNTKTFTWGYYTTSSDSSVTQIGTQSVDRNSVSSTEPNITVYTKTGTEAVPAQTTVSFTGVTAGTTTAVVGTTQYNITVYEEVDVTINYTCDGTVVATGTVKVPSDATTTDTVTLPGTVSDGTNTYKVTNTTLTLANGVSATYSAEVTLLEGVEISIKQNETKEISVTLTDGQYVEWTSADSSYVGVAGKYDASAGAYTEYGVIVGHNVTTDPVLVSGTVYNADGSVAGIYKWLVTVTEGAADENTYTKHIYVDVVTIQNCTVYYSVNAGELVKINGTGVLVDADVTGHYNLMFFAAPDEGYALTYMAVTGSALQYYTLSDGNPDGTGSGAWPFVSATATAIPETSDDSAWVSGHGFRWALLEGNYGIEQLKAMFTNAIALGCDGATNFTKNTADSFYTQVGFVAQKLPTVEKSIVSITDGEGTTGYTDGMKVNIGDTINYQITVTEHAETTGDVYDSDSTYTATSPITESNAPAYSTGSFGTITYSNESLTDALTNNNGISSPDMGTSTTSDETYTYTTSLTLTMANFASVVEDGTITNVAELSYNYASSYSTGSLTADAEAVAAIIVSLPNYVIDFGLPVTIDLASVLGDTTISDGSATYGTIGTIADNGTSFTYTPTQVLKDRDFVVLTLSNDEHYGVYIYPATTVYYEESFITWDSNWSAVSDGNQAITVDTQTTEQLKTAAQGAATSDTAKQYNYGYDPAYATTTGASNGTHATTSVIGARASFTFTGTGIQVFANCTEGSGYVSVQVTDSSGAIVNMAMVDTIVDEGTTSATSGQSGDLYGLPIVSLVNLTGLDHDTYTVTITKIMDTEPVYIDGIRVFNTMEDSTIFTSDLEDNPEFYELRDSVLKAINISDTTSQDYGTLAEMADQVYAQITDDADSETPAAVITENSAAGIYGEDATAQDLLDNGPKNELYLYAGQTLTFKVTSSRIMQIGLKAPQGATTASITVNEGTATTQAVNSSVDMFYDLVPEAAGSDTEYTVSITNSGETILSVTLLKVCDDPSFAFASLTAEDIESVLTGVYGLTEEETETPTEPSEPQIPEEPTAPETEPTRPTKPGKPGSNKPGKTNRPTENAEAEEAEAILNIVFVNLRGKKAGSATLTETGNENSRCVFSASEISAQTPDNYRALWFFPAIVSYGDTATIIVTVI